MDSLSDLAFLADSRTSALVDRDGTIGWYCPRRFDGPSVFGAILDPDAGHWRIGPPRDGAAAALPVRRSRRYEGETLVLRTSFEHGGSAFDVVDFLALEPGARGHELGRGVPHVLCRVVEGIRGRSTVELELAARFEYGLTVPRARVGGRTAHLEAGPFIVRLDADVDLRGDGDAVRARFELGAGETAAFALSSWDALDGQEPERRDARALRDATLEGWGSWMSLHRRYDGVATDAVRRSALVLQGLTDARTGAVVAAATTSLPEVAGGSANWDYRYAWLRDLSFVMRALWVAACPDEADAFLRFLAGALGRLDHGHVPIVVGSDGRRDLGEHTLDGLRGFGGAQPVRIGNRAWRQRQLDVLGEVIDSAHLLRERIGEPTPGTRELLVEFADRAARDWRLADAGMWEARDRERHYTSSKVMCWVAVDRAIDLADALGVDPAERGWVRARDEIRAEILERAWSAKAGGYAGAFDSDRLDASVLLMPLVGFLAVDDPRMTATVDAIIEGLTSGPLVHRWDGDDNGFVLCSYWLAECEALLGRHEDALRRFEALGGYANDVGVMTEMVDPRSGEPLGNLPQAFSHIGLINAAWRLTETR